MRQKVLSLQLSSAIETQGTKCIIRVAQRPWWYLFCPQREPITIEYISDWPFIDWVDVETLEPVSSEQRNFLHTAFRHRFHLHLD
jgi:hypothetical protein